MTMACWMMMTQNWLSRRVTLWCCRSVVVTTETSIVSAFFIVSSYGNIYSIGVKGQRRTPKAQDSLRSNIQRYWKHHVTIIPNGILLLVIVSYWNISTYMVIRNRIILVDRRIERWLSFANWLFSLYVMKYTCCSGYIHWSTESCTASHIVSMLLCSPHPYEDAALKCISWLIVYLTGRIVTCIKITFFSEKKSICDQQSFFDFMV